MTQHEWYWGGGSPCCVNCGTPASCEASRYDLLKAALVDIADRPTVERNPDGDDQAAATMQLIARETLEALGGSDRRQT